MLQCESNNTALQVTDYVHYSMCLYFMKKKNLFFVVDWVLKNWLSFYLVVRKYLCYILLYNYKSYPLLLLLLYQIIDYKVRLYPQVTDDIVSIYFKVQLQITLSPSLVCHCQSAYLKLHLQISLPATEGINLQYSCVITTGICALNCSHLLTLANETGFTFSYGFMSLRGLGKDLTLSHKKTFHLNSLKWEAYTKL